MLLNRLIPVLLLKDGGLVKTRKFADPVYLGDPVNAVKIFNEKCVDELIILDITASLSKSKPQLQLIEEVAGECFMPIAYGGGIRDLEDIRAILSLGVEKVVLNTIFSECPGLVREAADMFGSQSIVVSFDVKRNLFGKTAVYAVGGRRRVSMSPVDYAQFAEDQGAGELFVNSIDRDGSMAGFDLELINEVTHSVKIPTIVCGGAGSLADCKLALNSGASAVAAGSYFVFQGKHRAVLISYPSEEEINKVINVSGEKNANK